MKQLKSLLYFEWLNFKAEKGLVAFTVLLLFAGGYGIFTGQSAIEKQRAQMSNLSLLYNDNVKELKKQFPTDGDAGDIAYYHSYFVKHIPDGWAALSIGQRDVNPGYLKVRLLALQGQLYNSENTNPNQLAVGSFDLAFVFVFLLPLFIISISFNLLSADKENGTLTMVLSQPISLARFCFAKLLFRFLLVLMVVCILLGAGILWTSAVADLRVGYWFTVIVLYTLFWFGVVSAITALNRGSAFNAVSLIGIWLMLTIIFPTTINILATYNKPIPDGMEITMKQREEVHEGWDHPKEETMKRFFVHYPAYKNTGPIKGRFQWKWYFAFQELGDRSVAQQSVNYAKKLQDREHYTSALSILSTPATLQKMLNASAATDLEQHLDFLESVSRFHTALKAHYYPFLFNDKPWSHQDYLMEPQHSFQAKPDQKAMLWGLMVLISTNILVFIIALITFRFSNKAIK
jgi:ABC-2 type transport system permease protein